MSDLIQLVTKLSKLLYTHISFCWSGMLQLTCLHIAWTRTRDAWVMSMMHRIVTNTSLYSSSFHIVKTQFHIVELRPDWNQIRPDWDQLISIWCPLEINFSSGNDPLEKTSCNTWGEYDVIGPAPHPKAVWASGFGFSLNRSGGMVGLGVDPWAVVHGSIEDHTIVSRSAHGIFVAPHVICLSGQLGVCALSFRRLLFAFDKGRKILQSYWSTTHIL